MSKKADLKKLQSEWYKKLKDEGFDDIEYDEYELRRYSSHWRTRHTLEEMQAKAAYYQMAEQFLNEHTFDSELEKTIWEYHTNAISVRDIAATLKKTGVFTISKTTVASTVNTLAHRLKLKYLQGYKEEDQN